MLLKLSSSNDGKNSPKPVEYEVVEPEMPENIRIAKEKANKEARGLYE